MVLRIKGVRSGRDIGAGVERACTALQWQTAKACALFDHAADMPVEMNRVINGALHRAGLDPNVAVLPPDSAKGWVNGRLEIALGAFLRALDHSTRFEPGVGDMCVAAVLANDLEERKLVITVRAPTCQCSLHFAKLLSDAIGGTFEKHSQGPLFDVYAAGRMLLDCNAIIGMPDQRFDPVLLIHIPFPENIQSAG
jgi:hypothetical protein